MHESKYNSATVFISRNLFVRFISATRFHLCFHFNFYRRVADTHTHTNTHPYNYFSWKHTLTHSTIHTTQHWTNQTTNDHYFRSFSQPASLTGQTLLFRCWFLFSRSLTICPIKLTIRILPTHSAFSSHRWKRLHSRSEKPSLDDVV